MLRSKLQLYGNRPYFGERTLRGPKAQEKRLTRRHARRAAKQLNHLT